MSAAINLLNRRVWSVAKVWAFLSLVSVLAPITAMAAPVLHDWTFTGVTTRVDPGISYAVGQPYFIRFTLDSSKLTTKPSGVYFASVGVLFEISGSAIGVGGGPGVGVLVKNDAPLLGGGSVDGILFSLLQGESDGFPAHENFDGTDDGINLLNRSAGSTATPFTSTAFPESLDLNQFTERQLALSLQVGIQVGEVRGTVDRFYIDGVLISEVPEPGSFAILALALAVAGSVCKVRRCAATVPR